MKRCPSNLGDEPFDVLVVGAGIHGACLAREAALRGLSVALVDRGDFGAATSANSQRILHGGLRYLQSLDFKRMRESVRERRAFMRMAPHLVQPLPFVVPTFGWGTRSKAAMRWAFRLCDWIAPDRGIPGDVSAPLPAGTVLSKHELTELLPGLAALDGISGGALWYDGQAHNTERITLGFVRSAVELGAVAVNYAPLQRLVMRGNRVIGAVVGDCIGGGEYEVSCKMLINAAGPWKERTTRMAGLEGDLEPPWLAKGWNIVVRAIHPTHAFGVPLVSESGSRGKGRMLFVTPWRGHSIVGTMYAPARDDEDTEVTDQEVELLVDEFNRAYPAVRLGPDEVLMRQGGLLPVRPGAPNRGFEHLSDSSEIIDHQRVDGVEGMLSVLGVKYTTARGVAEVAIDHVCALLEHPGGSKDNTVVAIDGGDIDNLAEFGESLRKSVPAPLRPFCEHLVRSYGTRTAEVLAYCRRDDDARSVSPRSDVIRAQVRYAVREEMAVTLSDVIMRRTGLGTLGHPGEEAIQSCRAIMAEELNWTAVSAEKETSEVRALFH
jgi:glycerol-3-phosphate dehydrogenase